MMQLATTKGMDPHGFSDEDLSIINEAVPASIAVSIPAGGYRIRPEKGAPMDLVDATAPRRWGAAMWPEVIQCEVPT
jgi:hypothetical protein